MPALTPQRALTWPGPLTSGVARMVLPSRSSTGLSAATTSPLNQPLIACPMRPGISHGATHVDSPLGDAAPGGDVAGVGTADGPSWIADVGDGVVAGRALVGSGADTIAAVRTGESASMATPPKSSRPAAAATPRRIRRW